jgi:hypothetical protein
MRAWEVAGKAMGRCVNCEGGDETGQPQERAAEAVGRRWRGGRRWEDRCGDGHDMTAVRMRRSHEDWEGAGKAMGRRWEGV